jgi:predicted acetyltransferase
MSIELEKIASIDRPVLERLFQYYLHDISEYSGWALEKDGSFSYPIDLLPPYWEKQDHYPYFIVNDGEIAGFSLIRRVPELSQVWEMGQFFVVRKFRGKDHGRSAFEKALYLHSGQWQVRVLIENIPAYHFWKARIDDVSKGDFSEVKRKYHNHNMTYFTFKTSP